MKQLDSEFIQKLFWVGGILLFSVAAAVGIFARFSALGGRLLADDEYFFITSVNAIVDSGLPVFETGGFYVRGLLVQYMTALSVWLYGDNGYAYRLPSVLMSLASAAAMYFYARSKLPTMLAAVVAALLLVSSWEIEFARFARMYASFQFMTILFLLAIDRVFYGQAWTLRYTPHLIAVLAMFTHALGVLLLPLLFIPVVVSTIRERFISKWHMYRYVLITTITIAVCVGYQRYDFLNLGVEQALPPNYYDLYPQSHRLFRVPEFPFWHVSSDPADNLLFLLGTMAVSVLAFWMWQKRKGRTLQIVHVVSILLVVSAILHTFVVMLACAFILIARYRVLSRPFSRKYELSALGIALLATIAWVGYALVSQGWLDSTILGNYAALKSMVWAFAGWPDLFSQLLIPWGQHLPVLGGAIAMACAYQVIRNIRKPLFVLASNPAVIILYVGLAFGVLDALYNTMRYWFFVYPVGLYVIVLSIKDLTATVRVAYGRQNSGGSAVQHVVVSILSVALFCGTEDCNPEHIRNVGSEKVGFRLAEYEPYQDVWYPRLDYLSPAEYLNSNAVPEAGERIVVLGLHSMSFYLKEVHARYFDRESVLFRNVSRRQGTVDLWSNQRLLSTKDEVVEYTKAASRVWIARKKSEERKFKGFEIDDIWRGRNPELERVFISRDGRLEVLRVDLSLPEGKLRTRSAVPGVSYTVR